MKLSIVIPAYNEEAAIGRTIERCLEATETIKAKSPIDAVELIVVSDGSVDQTATIAKSFENVRVIEFESNRGYGAAIKAGFEAADGDLLGFLDADGTCDPAQFAPLCRALVARNADVAIGARMGRDSRMPLVRMVGNRFYALLLGVLACKPITDTASGMRVVRASSLADLYPLPDGMHFTPAMSARILMDDELKLVEVPMPYEERVGQSKLRLLRDGLRFALTIIDAALVARPTRVILPVLACLVLLVCVMTVHPLHEYVMTGTIQNWMIYRAVTALLIVTVGMLLLSAAVIADEIITIALKRPPKKSRLQILIARVFQTPFVAGLGTFSLVSSLLLTRDGLWDYILTGHVYIHWWRVMVSAALLIMAASAATTWLLMRIMSLLKKRQTAQPPVIVSAEPVEAWQAKQLALEMD
ncbi:MAG: glycosyltransferase family 2 protein [Phycisphaerae bacterium]